MNVLIDNGKTILISGKIMLPVKYTAEEAFERITGIAREHGYSVWWVCETHTCIAVCGGDITGHYVLEWPAADSSQVGRVLYP